jgi:hypothetical protein
MDKSTEEMGASAHPKSTDDASDVGYVFSPFPGLVAFMDTGTPTEETQDFSFVLLTVILVVWVLFTVAMFL